MRACNKIKDLILIVIVLHTAVNGIGVSGFFLHCDDMKIRTHDDNRQLGKDEVQIESVRGAISVTAMDDGRVQICCVRGIQGRKAQIACLDQEALHVLIEKLMLHVIDK